MRLKKAAPHKQTVSALARIQDVDRSAWTADSSVSGGGGRSIEAKVRLRVMPEGGAEFDSEARVWGMDAVQQLGPGRETYVSYDPERASHCDIDRERLRAEFGPARNGKDRVVLRTAAQAEFEEKLNTRDRDPAAYAEHLREVAGSATAGQTYAQAVREALRSGDLAEVERLKAQLATGAATVHSGSVHMGRAGSEDPLERLSRLADLHDRGALTDAEFAAEKSKILENS